MTSREIIEMYNRYVARTYNTLPVVLDHGMGVEVWDEDGKKYLDFWAAYSAVNLGHAHPEIITTAIEHLRKGPMFTRACYNKELALLGKELSELAGFDSIIIPKNSGAEGVETALKTARMWAYRTGKTSRNTGEIIVANQNFHGRTITIVSFSGEAQYRDDFGPLTPGFKMIPYGNLESLEKAVTSNTIALLLEPIQGEGGIIVPPPGYLRGAREICDKHGILLILDEIQTGLGRTGELFCYRASSIEPDILILGKSLGGGILPVSAEIGGRKIMELWQPGDDGSTFGGYSMAAAVARKAIEIIVRDKLAERSAELGKYFIDRLEKIDSYFIKEIRGKGLFVGIELAPNAGGARKYCERLLKEGVICKEAHENVLRLSPPLIVTKEQLDFAAEKIEKVLKYDKPKVL